MEKESCSLQNEIQRLLAQPLVEKGKFVFDD